MQRATTLQASRKILEHSCLGGRPVGTRMQGTVRLRHISVGRHDAQCGRLQSPSLPRGFNFVEEIIDHRLLGIQCLEIAIRFLPRPLMNDL